jgi:hypothetical protein
LLVFTTGAPPTGTVVQDVQLPAWSFTRTYRVVADVVIV